MPFSIKPRPSIIDGHDQVTSTSASKYSLAYLASSYDSDEDSDSTQPSSNPSAVRQVRIRYSTYLAVCFQPAVPTTMLQPSTATPNAVHHSDGNALVVQQTDRSLDSSSLKFLKIVASQATHSSSSIKMLSTGDGLSSALRVPTKIQLTKAPVVSSASDEHSAPRRLSSASLSPIEPNADDQRSTLADYPPTPPPPVTDPSHSKLHTSMRTEHEDQKNGILPNDSKGMKRTRREKIDFSFLRTGHVFYLTCESLSRIRCPSLLAESRCVDRTLTDFIRFFLHRFQRGRCLSKQ